MHRIHAWCSSVRGGVQFAGLISRAASAASEYGHDMAIAVCTGTICGLKLEVDSVAIRNLRTCTSIVAVNKVIWFGMGGYSCPPAFGWLERKQGSEASRRARAPVRAHGYGPPMSTVGRLHTEVTPRSES